MTAAYVIMALCVLIGVPFTLWWWREADKWADAEHKRFETKQEDPLKDAIVVKWEQPPPPPAEAARPPAGQADTERTTPSIFGP